MIKCFHPVGTLIIQCASEAALDMGQHIIRRERFGVPQRSCDVFALLERAGWIDLSLVVPLQNMVGSRNISGPDYQTLGDPPENRNDAEQRGAGSIRFRRLRFSIKPYLLMATKNFRS